MKKWIKVAGVIIGVVVVIALGFMIYQKSQIESPEEMQVRLAKKREEIKPYQNLIGIGSVYFLGLKEDGTVYACGANTFGECETKNWKDIVSVSACSAVSVGLTKEGRVLAVGINDWKQLETSDWKDIKDIAAGTSHILGVKEDGTVLASGMTSRDDDPSKEWKPYQNMVKNWSSIQEVKADSHVAMGLKEDGTVRKVDYDLVLDEEPIEEDLTGWKDIVDISVNEYGDYMALQKDGTVLTGGKLTFGDGGVEEWKDIVAIAMGSNHFVGLKEDGTVIAGGLNDDKQCEVEGWKDIVAVYAADDTTVGVKADGTVLVTGYVSEESATELSKWKLF